MTGIERIAAERQRQIDEKGWTPTHDLDHTNDELARAAAIYALPFGRHRSAALAHNTWPIGWDYRPHLHSGREGRLRELVKAGALIAAEIDRIEASK